MLRAICLFLIVLAATASSVTAQEWTCNVNTTYTRLDENRTNGKDWHNIYLLIDYDVPAGETGYIDVYIWEMVDDQDVHQADDFYTLSGEPCP